MLRIIRIEMVSQEEDSINNMTDKIEDFISEQEDKKVSVNFIIE